MLSSRCLIYIGAALIAFLAKAQAAEVSSNQTPVLQPPVVHQSDSERSLPVESDLEGLTQSIRHKMRVAEKALTVERIERVVTDHVRDTETLPSVTPGYQPLREASEKQQELKPPFARTKNESN